MYIHTHTYIYIYICLHIYIYVLYIHVFGNEYHHPVIRYKDINSTRTQPALNQVDITICTEYITSNPLNFIQWTLQWWLMFPHQDDTTWPSREIPGYYPLQVTAQKFPHVRQCNKHPENPSMNPPFSAGQIHRSCCEAGQSTRFREPLAAGGSLDSTRAVAIGDERQALFGGPWCFILEGWRDRLWTLDGKPRVASLVQFHTFLPWIWMEINIANIIKPIVSS